jgi:hypothetical protein
VPTVQWSGTTAPDGLIEKSPLSLEMEILVEFGLVFLATAAGTLVGVWAAERWVSRVER